MTISADTTAVVQDILVERGKKRLPGENFESFVARGLAISSKNARAYLAALENGNLPEDAMLIAGIESKIPEISTLIRIARAIGNALGTVVVTLRS